MKLAPMRFGGVSMRHNPAKLSISGKNRIHESLSPCCEADSRVIGRELRRIAGEGVLCGEDCIEQYRLLEEMQINRTPAKLVPAKMQPLYAYLKELVLTAEPKDNILHYRFLFIETQSPRMSVQSGARYLKASQGDSLWDISYLCGTPIEQLTALNPQIPFIDDIGEGERVRIC